MERALKRMASRDENPLYEGKILAYLNSAEWAAIDRLLWKLTAPDVVDDAEELLAELIEVAGDCRARGAR